MVQATKKIRAPLSFHQTRPVRERDDFNFRFGNDVYFPLGTKSVDIAYKLESLRINLDYFVLNKLPVYCFIVNVLEFN